MRSLDAARDSWDELKHYRTLSALREATRLDGHTSASTNGLRSACWKAFLLFDNVDTSIWQRILLSSRSAYNALRAHFLRPLDHPDELADPLSDETDSPWNVLQKDEELRAEIQQDVDRCMPENLYFRQPDTQRMMLDILFVFCKLNPDLSYRQGMHELLAPILWVIERDAVDLGQSSKTMGEDAIIKSVYDADHIEHDAFALFGQAMQSAKNFYEQTTHTAAENPIVSRSKRIVEDLLPQVDSELAQHLQKIDILPQVFLMRWIRLLFGREFPFDDVLTMWDVIFAEDPSLEIVDHICLTMLLRIRWELLESDYNGALPLLLKYPPPEKTLAPQSLVLDALYLREHMHTDGGSYLVLKYTGRALQPVGRPVTPPALQRNITAFSGVNAAKAALSGRPGHSADRRPKQARNIEAILQSTAKNIYARSESFGLGKAVRSAVDEVHRKAQEIRDVQTPSPPPANWRQRAPRTAQVVAMSKVKELEARNAQLSKLLEGAIGELWEYQKHAVESKADAPPAESDDSGELEQLSVAIAKAQFVSVYLGDSSLPLPDEEEAAADTGKQPPAPTLQEPPLDEAQAIPPSSPNPQKPISETVQPPQKTQYLENERLADPSTFDDPEDEPSTASNPTAPDTTAPPPQPAPPSPAPPSDPQPTLSPRPPLAESSYSWMLGQSSLPSTAKSPTLTSAYPKPATTSTSTTSPSRQPSSSFFDDQRRNRGFLFGDDDASVEAGAAAMDVVGDGGRRGSKGGRKKAARVVD